MRPRHRATSSRPAWPPVTALNAGRVVPFARAAGALSRVPFAQQLWRWARQPLRTPGPWLALYSGPRVADGYCVDIRCPPSDARRCRSTVTNAMRSRVGAEYRRRVHPALRARIRRWRAPAPPRQERRVTVVVTRLTGGRMRFARVWTAWFEAPTATSRSSCWSMGQSLHCRGAGDPMLAGIRVSGSWTSRWGRLPDPDQRCPTAITSW